MDNKEKINDILKNALDGIVDALDDMSAEDKESFLEEKLGEEDDMRSLNIFSVEIQVGLTPTQYSSSTYLKMDSAYELLFKISDKNIQKKITENVVSLFKSVTSILPERIEKVFKELQEEQL